MEKPAEEFVLEVDRRLRVYGQERHGNLDDPLEELVLIILSDQTEEYSFTKTYARLRTTFPSWDQLCDAETAVIAQTIKGGGLHNKKARYIKAALQKVRADFSELSLESLRRCATDEALQYLETLSGVSVKNARCIAMYSLGLDVFPVDTHVWRICRRLGLTPQVPKPTVAQQKDLESLVPAAVRYSLHVNMVSHGRAVCAMYWPSCDQCVLTDICPGSGKPDEVWGSWRKPRGVWSRYAERRRGESKA